MHLVDTNVLSELSRQRPNGAVLRWFERHDEIAISVISIEELAFGVAKLPASQRGRLAVWFESLLEAAAETLKVTPAIARAAGELRAVRASMGRPVAQADMLICATALVHGLTLATHNVDDFTGCGVVIVDPFKQ